MTQSRNLPTRRSVFQLAGTLFLCSCPLIMRARAQSVAGAANLLTAPIELGGEWGGSPRPAVMRVVERVREACLSGVTLLSDRQPDRIRIDEHASGNPSVWLHNDSTRTAWVIVDIGARDWCKLAYQFGHELGHVLANSWEASSQPAPPCQWLEESLVESFSIRGLGLLAMRWATDPPFAGDNAFAMSIRGYRQALIDGYAKERGAQDVARWFRASRRELESGAAAPKGPAVLAIVPELERREACVSDLGALNRWTERTRLPLEDYLERWTKSCAELRSPGLLPVLLKALFRL